MCAAATIFRQYDENAQSVNVVAGQQVVQPFEFLMVGEVDDQPPAAAARLANLDLRPQRAAQFLLQ